MCPIYSHNEPSMLLLYTSSPVGPDCTVMIRDASTTCEHAVRCVDVVFSGGQFLDPRPVPPSSFGLVRPAWIEYTRSAVPQIVEG